MPNILSHNYVAQKAKELLESDALKDTIGKFPQEYSVGAQGPDFLFYHSALPWEDKELCSISNHLGHIAHQERINDFYQAALDTIRETNDPSLQLAMISYVCGHLSHWALDSIAHPFVYYRTNGQTKETKYWHTRYESMLDNYMMDFYKRDGMEYMPIKKIIATDSLCLSAMKTVYLSVFKKVWNLDVKEEYVTDGMKDFRMLMSFAGKKTLLYWLIRYYEILVKDNWHFSRYFITGEKDETRDILNLNHQIWTHPCDNSEVHHESYPELIEMAIQRSKEAMDLFANALGNEEEDSIFIKYLGNRGYDTGKNTTVKMKYFDSIY